MPTVPPAAFFILFALAGGEKHGYAIMHEVRKISDNTFKIGPATLYTTIHRLLMARFIAEVTGPESTSTRRRYYRLTAAGNSALHSDLLRMEALVRKFKAMRLRLADPIPPVSAL